MLQYSLFVIVASHMMVLESVSLLNCSQFILLCSLSLLENNKREITFSSTLGVELFRARLTKS